MPPLPEEDTKIIIRPRRTLDASRVGATTVGRAIMEAIGIEDAKAGADVMCPHLQQNTGVVSIPAREDAMRYIRIRAIQVANKSYEVSAYEAVPHYACKGVLRSISLGDGPGDLERNIVNKGTPWR